MNVGQVYQAKNKAAFDRIEELETEVQRLKNVSCEPVKVTEISLVREIDDFQDFSWSFSVKQNPSHEDWQRGAVSKCEPNGWQKGSILRSLESERWVNGDDFIVLENFDWKDDKKAFVSMGNSKVEAQAKTKKLYDDLVDFAEKVIEGDINSEYWQTSVKVDDFEVWNDSMGGISEGGIETVKDMLPQWLDLGDSDLKDILYDGSLVIEN